MALKSIDYFERLQMGSHYGLGDVIGNLDHPRRADLVHDLNNVDSAALKSFIDKNNHLFGRAEDKEMAARQMYLEYHIADKIAERRLDILRQAEKGKRARPYDSDELLDLPIDEHGLVSIHTLDLYNFGLAHNGFVYQICPSLDQFNSCHWLGLLIMTESFRRGKNFKIRLDPLMKVPKGEFSSYMAKMHLHGKNLDWDRIRSLKSEEFGQWLGDGLSTSSIKITDYVWRPEGNEIHFTCEELPNDDQINLRGSRYFHAIFDKQSGLITHCDGALRIYDPQDYVFREKFHVRHPEVRKIGKRVKLFLIDDPIDQELFMGLATNFLVWNQDAIQYFN